MKIGIDIFGCEHGRSGLGSYLLSLVSNLPSHDDISYELFGSEVDRYTYRGSKDTTFARVNVPESLAAERMWHIFNVNSFARKQNYGVVYYAAGSRMLPLGFKTPSVALVNDIISNIFREADDFWLRRQIKMGLSKADCIIAPSEYIKQDLIKAKIRCKRIEVIYSGVDHSLFYPRTELDFVSDVVEIKPFAIKRPYFIYASRMHSAEKKHIELIKAFTLFKEQTKAPHRLVIAGSEGACSQEIHKAAIESSAASDIFITGYFPHENFPELYRNAEACVFPAVNEGGGLAILEAFACGIPVLCSNFGALKEVANDNAMFFDSDNIEDIAECMSKIVFDSELRGRLVKKGLEWSKNFSWENTANHTLEVLRDVASTSKKRR